MAYRKGRSMSTSCWFAMQLRLPLHHRRRCWYLTWPTINTSTTKHSQIRTRKIDRCQHCAALQRRSNRFATDGTDRFIAYSRASANGKHQRDIRNTYSEDRSMSTSCCFPAHSQSLWHHRHRYWYLTSIVTTTQQTTTQLPSHRKEGSMSTSCCFPMQLRFPLHHRRQCGCLT
jgi:hypothetical protein